VDAIVLKPLTLTVTVALALVPAWTGGAELPVSFQLAPEVLHLRINGLSVNSRVLTSRLEPTSACALLARQWQRPGKRGQPAPCTRAGRWLLVTHRTGNVLQTAQFEASGDGSDGFLSELDPLASQVPRTWPQLPLPIGARLVSAVQSVLGHDSVTQFTLELPWTPAGSLMRLRKIARESGWTAVAGAAASVVDFQRGGQAARAVALGSASGCTLVLVEHWLAGPGP
jgi:hypothetical protein